MAGYSKTKVDRAGRLLAEEFSVAAGRQGMDDGAREELEEAIRIIDWWRAEHVIPLSTVASNLFRYVGEEGNAAVAQRLKRVPTIAGKLAREEGMRLTQMEDVGGVRAVLPTQAAAYRVAQRLRKNWTITRFRDYVTQPKPDGYRALHLVNRNRGRLIEVQLRTPLQDAWGNAVEDATQRFPGIKTGGGPTVLRDFFVAASDISASIDGTIDAPSESDLAGIESAFHRADTFLQRLLDES